MNNMATGTIKRIRQNYQEILSAETGTITYVSNSIVTSTALARCILRRYGKICVLMLNLDLSTGATSANAFVTIGTLSFTSPTLATSCLPIQGSTANATLTVDQATLAIFKPNSQGGFVRGAVVWIQN